VATERREFVLPAKTDWFEVSKVLNAMQQELGEEKSAWADSVMVEATEAEIVFYYQKSRMVTNG
jgi:hypothetical protein